MKLRDPAKRMKRSVYSATDSNNTRTWPPSPIDSAPPPDQSSKLLIEVDIMLELVLFCVIAFAMGYVALLWFAGKRDDVLSGEFIQAETQGDFSEA
jgi:hypothetical protein